MASEDIYSWSTTAATNASIDPGINFAEGQTRSSVNNSARGMMAALAKGFRLFTGTVITGGIANTYTFTSGVGYTTVPTGLRVLLTIHATNTGASTLNMDGIGALPIVSGTTGTALVAGVLVATTQAEFMHSAGVWYLLSTSVPKLNTTGGTMTGALTVPSLTSTGAVSAGSFTTAGNASVTGTISVGTNLSLFQTGVAATAVQFAASGWRLGFDIPTGNLFYISSIGTILHTLGATGNFSIFGSAFKPGGGEWTDSSDARIKTVLGDYTSGLDEVNQLNPVRYTFKGNDQPRDTKREFIGLVAQEVEPCMPEMVKHSKGKIDGVDVDDLRILDTSALIFALVNSVQELTQRLEALEAKA